MMRVTIGIPFYNSAKTLADAVRSVFAQTYTDWELLLLDDGSTDGSLAIAQAITDPRVTVISDHRNLGLPRRLNQLAKLAKGEYWARFDADDLMHPERIARQVQFLDTYPDYDLVDSGLYAIDHEYAIHGKRDVTPLVVEPATMLERGILNHYAVFGRTSWFLQNPYDPTYSRAEDHELWCRTCQFTRFGRIPEPLVFYRELGVPTLKKYLETWNTDRRIILKYGPEILGKSGMVTLYGKAWAKTIIFPLATFCRMHHYIIRRRSLPLVAMEISTAGAIIAQILRTPLPGIDAIAQ